MAMQFQHADPSTAQAADDLPPPGFDDEAVLAQEQAPFVREGVKVGRNDPCPCGSGKKYKHCHGRFA